MAKTERFSYSKLGKAETCLARFREEYERDLRLPQTYSHTREVGKGVHACAEAYKAELHASGMEQDLSLIPIIVENYFSTDREVTTTATYDDVFFVFRAFAMKYRHNPKTYLGAEFLLQRELPETDIIIEGWPDHVDVQNDEHGPIVVSDDLKSGYSSTVTPEHKFQGEIVDWMLLPMFEGSRVGWRVSMPRADFTSPIEEFKPEYSQRLEARMRSIIARVHRAREEQVWPATPGSACAYCPIAAKCRERNVLADLDVVVTSADEAQKAAADLIILNAAYDQRREQLKAWADEEGPVEVGDSTVGYVTKAGGLKIADALSLVQKLGIVEVQREDGTDDVSIETEEERVRVIALGFRAAMKDRLLTVDGNRTKTKAIQNDERLNGLWVAGDSKTSFDIFKTPKKADAST